MLIETLSGLFWLFWLFWPFMPLKPPGFYCYNHKTDLVNVTIITTGGTIATPAESKITGPLQDHVHIADSCRFANIRVREAMRKGSHEITHHDRMKLRQLCQDAVDDATVSGVVITHGTDTLAETASFLDLTTKTDKPIVLTGAMRPPKSAGGDGRTNVVNSVALAAHQGAGRRGVMVSMNGYFGPARYSTKSDQYSLHAFQVEDRGFLGRMYDAHPFFWNEASRPTDHVYFDVTNIPAGAEPPKVEIIQSYQGSNSDLFEAAVDKGAKGIVAVGWFLPSTWQTMKKIAADRDIALVVAGDIRNSVGGISWKQRDPKKCLLQLQLLLWCSVTVSHNNVSLAEHEIPYRHCP